MSRRTWTQGHERLAEALAGRESQAALARDAGVGPDVINRLLKGERGPSIKLALQLEARLEIPVALWGETGDECGDAA